MNNVANLIAARILMAKDQLRRRGIKDERVLEAFRSVPREMFVRPEDRERAYDDEPLKIGQGQTISQPYIVALTCQSLELEESSRVLEIGTGSGYETAVLARLCRQVVSIERLPELQSAAKKRLEELGIRNVEYALADGTLGAPWAAPFHAIAVTAASPAVPSPLSSQLAPGGRMVIPIGDRVSQELFRYRKTPAGLTREKICDCRFVALIGLHGFQEPAAP